MTSAWKGPENLVGMPHQRGARGGKEKNTNWKGANTKTEMYLHVRDKVAASPGPPPAASLKSVR